jgi:DNA mismatch repair protein MutS2
MAAEPAMAGSARYDLDALEFQAVRELLLARLTTPLGRTAVADLRPLPDAAAASRARSATIELAQRLAGGERAPLAGIREVRGWLPQFFDGEHAAGTGDLADLGRLLRGARRCKEWLGAIPQGAVLAAWSAAMPDVRDLADELALVVDDRGEVLSSASVKLAELRAAIETAQDGVRAAVSAFLADESVRRCLQSPDPAWRNGRPVFQVRHDQRHAVPGVLHDRSQSGATLFIEPDVVIEAANSLADARAAEHREIQVILAHVCRGLRRNRALIEQAVAALVALDLAVACARLIAEDGFVAAELAAEGPLVLRDARHPILLSCTAPADLVPLDVTMGAPRRLLVITGPNTGGKTVVLKTLGLLALMAHCGVPVPAAQARFPWFDGVFADIGDEQGISQSLSTFSSHVRRIVRCLELATDRSLALLDELGAGTDPDEGGALGYAVLEELERRGVFAAVTTHLGRLKDFAYRHAGAENGSMAFDGRSLRPLYRLDVGVPGSSHALDVAGRVGMPSAIVARARALLGRRDARIEEAIEQVRSARRDAERDRQIAEHLARETEATRNESRDRLAELDRRRGWLEEEVDAYLDERLRSARNAVSDPLRRLRSAPGPFAAAARDLEEHLADELRSTRLHRRRMKFLGGVRRDAIVYVPRLRRRCTVHKVDRVREMIIVEVGKMRLEIPFEDVSWLQPLDEDRADAAGPGQGEQR